MSEEPGFVVRCKFHSARPTRRLKLRDGAAPARAPEGSVPRIARLLALAHHYQGLLGRGEIRDLTELADLVGITKPRLTQIMNLATLAPDIQEEILDLPRVTAGRAPVCERNLRPLARIAVWDEQRAHWREMRPTWSRQL